MQNVVLVISHFVYISVMKIMHLLMVLCSHILIVLCIPSLYNYR